MKIKVYIDYLYLILESIFINLFSIDTVTKKIILQTRLISFMNEIYCIFLQTDDHLLFYNQQSSFVYLFNSLHSNI